METFHFADRRRHTYTGDQAFSNACPILVRDLNCHQPVGRFYTFCLNGSDRVDYLAVVRKDFAHRFLHCDRITVMGTLLHSDRSGTEFLGVYPPSGKCGDCISLTHVTIGPSPERLDSDYLRINWGTGSKETVDRKREEFYQELAAAQKYRRILVITAV